MSRNQTCIIMFQITKPKWSSEGGIWKCLVIATVTGGCLEAIQKAQCLHQWPSGTKTNLGQDPALSCSTKTRKGIPRKKTLSHFPHHFCFCQTAYRRHTQHTGVSTASVSKVEMQAQSTQQVPRSQMQSCSFRGHALTHTADTAHTLLPSPPFSSLNNL